MTPTTDLQKLLAEATKGPWSINYGAHYPYDGHVYSQTADEHICGVFGEVNYGDVFSPIFKPDTNARLIAMAPDLAARVLELEAENKRLRGGDPRHQAKLGLVGRRPL